MTPPPNARPQCLTAAPEREPKAQDGTDSTHCTAHNKKTPTTSTPHAAQVWCQTCRHGGHAQHLEEWFAQHDVCPVADCNCRCALLDALAKGMGRDADASG